MNQRIAIPSVCESLHTLHQIVLALWPIQGGHNSSNQSLSTFHRGFLPLYPNSNKLIHYEIPCFGNVEISSKGLKRFQKLLATFHFFCTFASQSRAFLSQIFRCWWWIRVFYCLFVIAKIGIFLFDEEKLLLISSNACPPSGHPTYCWKHFQDTIGAYISVSYRQHPPNMRPFQILHTRVQNLQVTKHQIELTKISKISFPISIANFGLQSICQQMD